MIEALAIPADDRFQVIMEHPSKDSSTTPAIWCTPLRSSRLCANHIKCRTQAAAKAKTAEILAESPGLEPPDLLINLIEVSWENWSFGNGEAHYMDA
jgi:4-oxalocrotonate tautomerase